MITPSGSVEYSFECCTHPWVVVSRASDTPKLWRDMTPEEKGALLLAAHEGDVIQAHCEIYGWVRVYPNWDTDRAYRIKPESKVKVVTLNGDGGYYWGIGLNEHDTHKITFNLIDGKPDCASVKMECI